MNLKRKKEKKNSETNGIKKEKELKNIPELCLICESRIDGDCSSKESYWLSNFRPSIICFKPINTQSLSWYKDITDYFQDLFDLSIDLEVAYSTNVKEFLKYIEKLLRLANKIKDSYIRSLDLFKKYLEHENLKFKENYYHDVKYD